LSPGRCDCDEGQHADLRLVRGSTHLKRLMRSNMSSWDTSGYFRCSLIACMFAVEGGDRDGGGREEVVR
jgi:hypothetical protein